MTARCPQGHESQTDDFCDVCGEPIAAAAESSAAPAPPSEPAPVVPPPSSLTLPDPPAAEPPLICPSCSGENLHDALFCEECGYDFTTGQLPSEQAASVPSAVTGAEWVAELWIDPDWFATQDVGGKCATSGAPTVVPLGGTQALVGRRSQSRNVTPQIDCSGDGAVSHRQAELTLDHDRWYVEDLGSTNGTFVGTAGDPLPTDPITPHERHELADGERIYVGAWCRIVVRRATGDEKAGTTSA